MIKKAFIKLRGIIAVLMILLTGAGASASAPWEINPADYRYDMTVYLNVWFLSGKMDYSRFEVGAFYEEECRGIAEVLPLPEDGECLYLRIRSNEPTGEWISFRYYDRETDEVYDIEDTEIEFISNSRIGYPSDPFRLDINEEFSTSIPTLSVSEDETSPIWSILGQPVNSCKHDLAPGIYVIEGRKHLIR